METMGREREKALLKDNPYYRAGLEPHFSLIDIFHDCAEGRIGVDQALDRVLVVIDKTPTTTVLETTSYWFHRARNSEPAFEALPARLASHKLANVRAWAPGLMREPRSEAERTVFQRLLADRSSKVRRATANVAEARRWLSVIEMLKHYMQGLSDPEEQARVLRQCDFIVRGYRVEVRHVVYYSGKAPGGASTTTSSPAELVAAVPFERISREELEYHRRHGVWPTRPQGYEFRMELLANWHPLSE
jgi:hypothetical protein